MVSNVGTVHDGGVTDRDVITDKTGNVLVAMQYRVVLDVGSGPDPDDVELGAHDNTKQDECIGSDRHVPMQLGAFGHERGGVDDRLRYK